MHVHFIFFFFSNILQNFVLAIHMKRIFTTNLIFLLLLNAVIKPIWIFAIDRNVQITLGAQEYGLFFTLFNFTLFFNFLLDFGITNFNNREISFHPNKISNQFFNIIIIKATLALLYMIISIAAAIMVGFNNEQIKLLILLSTNQILASFILFIRSNLNALHHFKADSILSVLDKLILIALISIYLWGDTNMQFNVYIFALCQTFSYMLALISSLWLLLKRYNIHININLSKTRIKQIVKEGFPFATLVLLMSLYGRLDTVFIERLSDKGALSAGVYAQAFRLFDAFNMYPFLFASLMLPVISRMLSEKIDISDMFRFNTIILIVPVIAVAVPTIIFDKPLMSILYKEHIEISAEVLKLLMGSFFFVALSYLFGTALTANGNIWLLCRISLFTLVVNILLSIILIPQIGVIGAGFVNLISNGIAAVLQWFFFTKTFRIKIDWVITFKIVIFIIATIIVSVIFFEKSNASILGYIGAILAILVLAFLSGLIKLKSMITLLKDSKGE